MSNTSISTTSKLINRIGQRIEEHILDKMNEYVLPIDFKFNVTVKHSFNSVIQRIFDTSSLSTDKNMEGRPGYIPQASNNQSRTIEISNSNIRDFAVVYNGFGYGGGGMIVENYILNEVDKAAEKIARTLFEFYHNPKLTAEQRYQIRPGHDWINNAFLIRDETTAQKSIPVKRVVVRKTKAK